MTDPTETPADEPANPESRSGRRILRLNGGEGSTSTDRPPEDVPAGEPIPIEPSLTVVPPSRETGRAFWLALLFGGFSSLLGLMDGMVLRLFGVAGPVLAVVLFAWHGWQMGWPRHGDSRQRFADAAYFLGFILTMWALIIGFLPAGLSDVRTLESREVLRHFGMALGATAAGLIARILVLQTPSPSREGLEAELERAAKKVADEARAIAAQLAAAREEMVREQQAAVARQHETVTAMLEIIRQELHEALAPIRTSLPATIGDASRTLANAVTDLTVQVRENGESIESASQRMREGFASAGESAERLAGVGRNGAGSLSQLLAALGSALAAGTAQMNEVSQAAARAAEVGNGAADELEATLMEIARLRTEIADSVGTVTSMPAELADASEIVREELAGFRSGLDASLSGMQARVEADLVGTATALEQALERFREAVVALDRNAS